MDIKIKPLALIVFLACAAGFPSLTAATPRIYINEGQEKIVNNEWMVSEMLGVAVGYKTDGSLIIDNGGNLTTGRFVVGLIGSTGTVNVINGGSLIIERNAINQSNGFYRFSIGGNGDDTSGALGSKGILNISGPDSIVRIDASATGDVTVGERGAEGIINITNGGKMMQQNAQSLYIGGRYGQEQGTKGTVNVDGKGSSLDATTGILVGAWSNGALNVTNGATVTTPGTISAGYEKYISGDIKVSGKDSILYAGKNLGVGVFGPGSLYITDGAQVQTDANFTLAAYYVNYLGYGIAPSILSMDAGTFLVKNDAFIGTNGIGHVDLANNSLLEVGGNLYIAQGGVNPKDGKNLLSVAENSQIDVGKDIYINQGYNTRTDITLSENGQLNAEGNMYVTTGHGQNATANITISDSSQLNIRGGSLYLTDGAQNNQVANLIIGAAAGEKAAAAGQVNVENIVLGSARGSVIFNHTNQNYAFNANISGTGAINALHGTTALNGDNTFAWTTLFIDNDAKIAVSEQKNLGQLRVNLNAADSTLKIRSQKNWQFSNVLSGTGILDVDTGGNQFSFGSFAGTQFQGTVKLQNSSLTLMGQNVDSTGTVMTKVNLIAGEGSRVNLRGGQNLNGLSFDGGTVNFGEVTPGQYSAPYMLTVSDRLDLSGEGNVQVSTEGKISNDIPTGLNTYPLLQQDDQNRLIQLAVGTGTTGTGANLKLIDQNGDAITDETRHDITQNGTTVAEGTYDYRLTTGSNNQGLYINYGLTGVNLLGTGDNALALNAVGRTGIAADLSAQVTGSGDLAIDTGNGQQVSLSNQNNSYTGVTDVRSGHLSMLNDNVLGNTSELSLAADTGLDMNGYKQTIGRLNGQEKSVLNLGGGSLTLSQGGVSAGQVTGEGKLTVNDVLTIYGQNYGLSAKTTITENASVIMHTVKGLGTGDIDVTGTLQFERAGGTFSNDLSSTGRVITSDHASLVLGGNNQNFQGSFDIGENSQILALQQAHLGASTVNNEGSLVLLNDDNWDLTNTINGSGTLVKLETGTLSLSDNALYTGATDIEEGGIVSGSINKPILLPSNEVRVFSGAFLAGYGGLAGNLVNDGDAFVGGNPSDGNLPLAFNIKGNVTNSGAIYIRQQSNDFLSGNTLLVNGDYHGDDGQLYFNTALAGDNSSTDKMVVNGNTSGSTLVSVTNAGGDGAKTLNGIELIHIDGDSSGDFVQSGRIVAGAYDYSLVRGNGTTNSGNWYLTNVYNGPALPEPDPTPNPQPETPDPTQRPPAGIAVIRPEAGGYIANLASANTLFVTSLHDRLGETQYVDVLTGKKKVTSLWLRQTAAHNNWRDSSGQLKTQSNRYALQLGGDLTQWSTNGLNRLHLGVMAGYGNTHSNTRSRLSGNGAKSSLNGYNVGLYSTWFDNEKDKTGTYVDGWLQYNWFDNHISGDNLAQESYKSDGFTASIEVGHTVKLSEYIGSAGDLHEWFIQPQAQAVWMGIKANDHTEANGTRISSRGENNIQTRLGVRTYLKSHLRQDTPDYQSFEPFIEANWLHNSKSFGVTMNGVSMEQEGTQDMGELKVGVEGLINQSLTIWGNVGFKVGDAGYNDNAVMLGVKYNF